VTVQQAAARPHVSTLMVVFGCGAGVKGLSAASRQDGMAFRSPCRAALDRVVDEDQGPDSAGECDLKAGKILRCAAAASAARRVADIQFGCPHSGAASLMRA
jgi:hypothetical protein